MKKFVLLFIYVFLMLPVLPKSNFQELSLEKALEKAKGEGKWCLLIVIPHGVAPVRFNGQRNFAIERSGGFFE